MARLVTPALRALLSHSIDYAGLFPPASRPLPVAVAEYERYRGGEFAWMLGRFVVSSTELGGVPLKFDGPLAVLSNCDQSRASAIETKTIIATPKPTYCEVSIQDLGKVASVGAFAKLRTGGIMPEAIPSVESVASYLQACAERRLPFKATAGLHHPIRSIHPLTSEPDAPRSMMYGFINFMLASAFAWHGQMPEVLRRILSETDPAAFRFNDSAHWRDHSLSKDMVAAARRDFVHSFGSCSFTDPVEDLQGLGWL